MEQDYGKDVVASGLVNVVSRSRATRRSLDGGGELHALVVPTVALVDVAADFVMRILPPSLELDADKLAVVLFSSQHCVDVSARMARLAQAAALAHDGKFVVLVATTLLAEGLNVPQLMSITVTAECGGIITVVQALNRVAREGDVQGLGVVLVSHCPFARRLLNLQHQNARGTAALPTALRQDLDVKQLSAACVEVSSALVFCKAIGAAVRQPGIRHACVRCSSVWVVGVMILCLARR